MIFFRSVLFNFFFIVWTLLCTLVSAPLAIFGRYLPLYIARLWGQGVQALLKFTIGLTFEIQDRHYIPQSGSYILACKHQSAWETTMIQVLSFDSAIILKRELMWIPIFGQVLRITGAIGINRKKGRSVLRDLITSATKQAQKGRPIFIFPEGTRGQPGKAGKYHSGVYALYHNLNLPVIPVALNSGYFWPRRGFRKHPGHIVLKVLPPLQPGLGHEVFMEKLRDSIEIACQSLPVLNYNDLKTNLKTNHEYS